MKKVAVITVLISTILICVYYLIGSMIPKGRPMGTGNFPVEVNVTEVKVRPVAIKKNLPARIKSTEISQVRPQISGVILERFFEEGSFVQKGQDLYQIDPRPIFVELEKARIKFNSTKVASDAKKDNYERHLKLFAIKAISKNQLDNARIAMEKVKTDFAIAQSELKLLNIKLNYSKVPAPISGKIGKSLVTKGQLVKDMQEQPLAIITSLERLYADINESSNEIKQIQDALMAKEKINVTIYLPNKPNEAISRGFLKFSESIVDESTGSVSLRAEFDNKEKKLMPGLFVKAQLDLGVKDLLTVNQSSVVINTDGSMMVYIVSDDNKAIAKTITISGQSGTDWIVTSGVSAGDLIVKEGIQKIKPGSDLIPSLENEKIINTTDNISTTELNNQASKTPSAEAVIKSASEKDITNSQKLNLSDYEIIDQAIDQNLLSNEEAAANSSIAIIEDLNNEPEISEIDKKIYDFIKQQLRDAKNSEQVNVIKETKTESAEIKGQSIAIKDKVKEELDKVISDANKIIQTQNKEG